tara:strand:+ start:9243 stop:9506 length:264 start_codon:yes stop_codon:yes gene_type:complete
MSNLIPPKRGEFFSNKGQPTLRTETWIEGITTETNTTTEIIESPVSASVVAQISMLLRNIEELKMMISNKSEIAALRQRLDDLEQQL